MIRNRPGVRLKHIGVPIDTYVHNIIYIYNIAMKSVDIFYIPNEFKRLNLIKRLFIRCGTSRGRLQ